MAERLSEQDVLTIRKLVRAGTKPRELARVYKRATDTIRKIARGEMYESVEDPEVLAGEELESLKRLTAGGGDGEDERK